MALKDSDKVSSLPPDFQQAADPSAAVIEPLKVIVSLPLDADLLAYFQSEIGVAGWAEHMNGVLRYHMDTTQAIEADFEAAMATPAMQPSG